MHLLLCWILIKHKNHFLSTLTCPPAPPSLALAACLKLLHAPNHRTTLNCRMVLNRRTAPNRHMDHNRRMPHLLPVVAPVHGLGLDINAPDEVPLRSRSDFSMRLHGVHGSTCGHGTNT